MTKSFIKERLSMTRFRFHVSFAVCLLVSSPSVRADDNEKSAKKEVAFGIDVARRGLWQEARFRFEQATTLNPDSASAFNNLGVTLEQQGNFEKARSAYERALQLEPKNISIQQNYDLFREADEKRNKKLKKDATPKTESPAKPKETPTPEPAPKEIR
jgi:Tfp pilus assembly protein PilF